MRWYKFFNVRFILALPDIVDEIEFDKLENEISWRVNAERKNYAINTCAYVNYSFIFDDSSIGNMPHEFNEIITNSNLLSTVDFSNDLFETPSRNVQGDNDDLDFIFEGISFLFIVENNLF